MHYFFGPRIDFVIATYQCIVWLGVCTFSASYSLHIIDCWTIRGRTLSAIKHYLVITI